MSIELPVKGGQKYVVAPQKIIGIGLNYVDHIKESVTADSDRFKDELPSEPIIFCKTANTLIGPEEEIVIPGFIHQIGFRTCRTDYEGELAVIIGAGGRNIAEDDAYDHVFGFSCYNDVSQRNFQKHDKSGWFRGKSLDTFGPIGPVVVPMKEVGDPQSLDITTRLNGEVVQESNTRHMIFTIPQIISFISKQMTLAPGDIIATGTPSGVGPIKGGDVVEVEIEKIGVLRNPVRDE